MSARDLIEAACTVRDRKAESLNYVGYWLDPSGELHNLSENGTHQSHRQWAIDNMGFEPTELEDLEAMFSRGWVRVA